MANPNIVNVTSILGKNAFLALTTSYQTIITNANNSDKILKINSLIVNNIDGTNAASVSSVIANATGLALLGYLANTISVPADSSLVLISKDTSIYLLENQVLRLQASANSDLHATISYEEISWDGF